MSITWILEYYACCFFVDYDKDGDLDAIFWIIVLFQSVVLIIQIKEN
jgi:hypothetical protein